VRDDRGVTDQPATTGVLVLAATLLATGGSALAAAPSWMYYDGNQRIVSCRVNEEAVDRCQEVVSAGAVQCPPRQLLVALEERSLDLKLVALALGAPRFSFGSAALLYEVLGVRPGSVTPFALANDTAHRVTVVLDRAMLEHDPLNYHPLENDRTTAIAPADLLRFIADCGHHPRIVDLDLAAPAA